MTYNDFIWKHNTKYCDYDGYYGNQCVDLIRFKIKEVDGFDPYTALPAGPTAIAIWNNFKTNKYYKKVFNNPASINHPVRGDIVFFKYYPFLYGTVGHVELCDQADGYFMVNFTQNWKTGTPCHFEKRGVNRWLHGYRGCVGWLTPQK